MRVRFSRFASAATVIVFMSLALGLTIFALPENAIRWDSHDRSQPSQPAKLSVELRPKQDVPTNEPITLSAERMKMLGITLVKTQSAPVQVLDLDGTLLLDQTNFVHVRPRFEGDVIALGEIEETPPRKNSPSGTEQHTKRPVQFGDTVKKGQLLAVIWSRDLGEKKSELIENVSKLRLDATKLERINELFAKGAVPEQTVREAERSVQLGMVAVARSERTLRSWKMTDDEIGRIHAEAEQLHIRKGKWNQELEATWGRVESRASLDGTILEKNCNIGESVTIDHDLFKVADVRRLHVVANVYEEDIPSLQNLARNSRQWKIFLRTDPHALPLEGHFDRIGDFIDTNQHTAQVTGWVDNSSSRLRVGQFVRTRIDIPASPDEVAVPASAVLGHEGKTFVFVCDGPHGGKFARRCVTLKHTRDEIACLKGSPPGNECGSPALQIGEWVVATGTAALEAEFEGRTHSPAVTTSH